MSFEFRIVKGNDQKTTEAVELIGFGWAKRMSTHTKLYFGVIIPVLCWMRVAAVVFAIVASKTLGQTYERTVGILSRIFIPNATV